MSLNVTGILDSLTSHALALGVFERVNGHEPKAGPGNGLTAAFWVDRIEPMRVAGSGLAVTSVRLVVNCRIYTSMLQEPQDAIDPLILAAVDTLMAAYSGDFDLNSTIRCVDLLGSNGPGLSAQAGYLNQDGRIYRVMTITIPLLVDDLWAQVS